MIRNDRRLPFGQTGRELSHAAFCLIGLFFLLFPFAGNAPAQNSAPGDSSAVHAPGAEAGSPAIPPNTTVHPESVQSPAPKDINPKKAMLRSLMIPGGGQKANGSRKKELLFIATELVCLGGVIYETHLLGEDDLSALDKEYIQTNRNTFILVWLGAKLFAMVDAYVDAQFKHFTVDDVTPPGMPKSDENPADK